MIVCYYISKCWKLNGVTISENPTEISKEKFIDELKSSINKTSDVESILNKMNIELEINKTESKFITKNKNFILKLCSK